MKNRIPLLLCCKFERMNAARWDLRGVLHSRSRCVGCNVRLSNIPSESPLPSAEGESTEMPPDEVGMAGRPSILVSIYRSTGGPVDPTIAAVQRKLWKMIGPWYARAGYRLRNSISLLRKAFHICNPAANCCGSCLFFRTHARQVDSFPLPTAFLLQLLIPEDCCRPVIRYR